MRQRVGFCEFFYLFHLLLKIENVAKAIGTARRENVDQADFEMTENVPVELEDEADDDAGAEEWGKDDEVCDTLLLFAFSKSCSTILRHIG